MAQFHARRGGEAFALQHGAETRFDILGATEALDVFVSQVFQAIGQSGNRPPLLRENQIPTASLRLSAETSTETSKNAAPGCKALKAALDGGPDDVFDLLANRSTRDRAWWRAAVQNASTAPSELISEQPFCEATYAWRVVHTDSPLDAEVAARWDVMRLPVAGGRTKGSSFCVRERITSNYTR